MEFSPSAYPSPKRDEAIIDDFNGIKVPDPYRWMEDPDSPETKEFVNQLNAISAPFLQQAADRENMKSKLAEMMNFEKFGCISKHGDFYYYLYNSGLQNHSVLYQTKSLTEKGEVFLDVNKLSEDGTTALTLSSFSQDGTHFAYGLSEKGSDWVTAKFKLTDGTDLPDVIYGVKFSQLSWLPDNSGLFYSSYPGHQELVKNKSTVKLAYHSVYFHKMGTNCDEDVLVFELREDPDYIMIDYVDYDEDSMLLMTSKDSPMLRVVRVDLKSREMTEVIPEDPKNKINWVKPLPNGRLLVAYLEGVKAALYVHCSKTGKRLYNIPLPIGALSDKFASKSSSEVFLQFEFFTIPGITYGVDVSSSSENEGVELKVPMFVILSKHTQLNGTNPTFLEGYGGFGLSKAPKFSIYYLLFVKYFGGVVASTNIRGGGEYGEKWHKDGMREKKQNVFDDFIEAAEFLIKKGYTKSPRLAINGGSNGGLLVAACSQQKSDLFGAVINRVGLLDMLRFHKFTVGGAWIPEYGNPENKDDFPFIYEYSPLHNIKLPVEGQWPSTLLMTADHDDRVVPCHTLKYIATLINEARQHSTQARIEVSAGHGMGKPTTKLIDEWVDMFSFLQLQLKTSWNKETGENLEEF